jgi:hypothetical protein
VHATAQRLGAFLHFRPDQRAKGRAVMQAACNRAKWAHPSDFQRTQHGGPGPRVMQPAWRWQAGRSSGHVVSQAHVPSGGSERTLSHGVKTARPRFVPRTASARATAALRTTRPVALTPRRDRRRLWQGKRATLRLRHNDRVKKGTPRHSILYPFPFPLSLSYNRDRERGYLEKETGSEPPY